MRRLSWPELIAALFMAICLRTPSSLPSTSLLRPMSPSGERSVSITGGMEALYAAKREISSSMPDESFVKSFAVMSLEIGTSCLSDAI